LEKYIKINSVPESINLVEKFVEDIANEYSVNEDVFGNMLVTVTEGANNAIYHGNKCSPDKSVIISALFLEKNPTLVFKIKDQGEGFDYDNLPDPTHPDNLLKASGRGVYIMKELADVFYYTDSGKELEMHFKIAG
jgi:serine/threonine-protein kinase RsbW